MKRKALVIVSIIVIIIVAMGATYAYSLQNNPDRYNCRQGNILDGVNRQARFTVLSSCQKVVGVVHDMEGTKEDDGDYQFNLALEQPYIMLLNQENYKQGMLVVEIIPKDQSSTLVQIPKNGDRIQAYGVWVTDNPHGWNELHPTWELKKLV